MRGLLKIFFISTILLAFGNINAQNDIYTFKQISYEQGLPGVNVRNIFQDSRGVMWFAVESMGVCKYYGNKFIQYQNIAHDTTSLSSNFTNKILEDRAGNIWIATDFGLNRYNRDTDSFTRYFSGDRNGLASSLILDLFINPDGVLWIGTGNGLCRYDAKTDTFKNFLYNSDPVLNDVWEVRGICEGPNGLIWLGTNKGLLKFNPATKEFTQWSKPAYQLKHNSINTIRCINNDVLWIGTHRGLNKFDLNEEEFLPWKYNAADFSALNNEGVSDIFNDNNGNLWVGTYTKGIIRISLEKENYVRISNKDSQNHGLKSDHIRHIFKDKTGSIWIATKFEGLFLHDLNKTIFSKWPEKYSTLFEMKDKHIMSFYADPKYEGVFWLASKFDGLYRVNTKTGQTINYRHNIYRPTTINADRIHDVERDQFGDLYIASEEGLDLLVEEAQEFDHITDLPINLLEAGTNVSLWLGTDIGLFVFNHLDGRVERHRSKHSFFRSNIQIKGIYKDRKNKMWFSTDHSGLFWYDPHLDSLKLLSDSAAMYGVNSSMIRPLFEGSDGSFWIGSKDNGLYRVNENSGHASVFNVRHGLPANFVMSIEEDKNNNLWIATLNGLSRFDTESLTFTNFNKEYGLQNNIFEVNLSHNFGDGYLMFGGNNGFNIFNPDSINYKHTPPSLLFSSVKVMDREIQRDITENQEVSLSYDENYLTIEFGLTDYSNPAKHQFAYKLEGLDKEWNFAGNRNYASYSSLAPGQYTLRVRGANEIGVWNNKGIELKITINPPFYDTWIFKTLAGVLLVLFAYLIYRNKSLKNKRTKQLLELRIKERTQELQNALKELREQQTKIENQNEALSAQYREIVSQKDHIQKINDQLNQAHEELKEINSDLDKRVRERTEKLVKTNQELDRFVYSASHDLSAPLKSILGLIHIAKFETKDKSLLNNLEYMERSIKKLEEVIKSLTQFSRNMGHEVKKTNIKFDEIVEDILNESKTAYRINEYQIIKDYNLSTLIYSDYLRIRIVLTNLISNTFKYKKSEDAGPTIKVSLSKGDDQYIIKIRDHGIGISEQNRDKVFDMFYRGTNQSEGSGLGLYIVAETLSKLDGTIEVNSKPQQFTEFTVKLPVIQPIKTSISDRGGNGENRNLHVK